MNSIWPSPQLLAFAQTLPFEYLLRKRSPAEALERWRCESSAYRLKHEHCRVALLMRTTESVDSAIHTIASWALQTWPETDWILVGEKSDAIISRLAEVGLQSPVATVQDVEKGELTKLAIDWVVPAIAGDILHPSLAGLVMQAGEAGASAFAWDWFTAEINNEIRVKDRRRGPFRDDRAEIDLDLRRRAFALRSEMWSGTPEASWTTRMSLPKQLATQSIVHPEPLAIYPRETDIVKPDPNIAKKIWGCDFEIRRKLMPVTAPRKVSVIILYRDRVDLTLEAINSVLEQKIPGEIELVLVDNQSSPSTAAAIEKRLRTLPPHASYHMLRYDEDFNHSAQCNLGAEHASGEVLVFLNNDARFLESDGLDALSRWAALPRIASVGACIMDGERRVGGGFRARRMPGAEVNSPVEEAAGASAEVSRMTVGNTFACAAVSSVAFKAIGGLDPVHFPVGYNDVDYCLRACRDGWHHVNLAEVRVSHAVGASRSRVDENAQKLALRLDHSWLFARSLQEHEIELIMLPPVCLPAWLPMADTAAGALLEQNS